MPFPTKYEDWRVRRMKIIYNQDKLECTWVGNWISSMYQYYADGKNDIKLIQARMVAGKWISFMCQYYAQRKYYFSILNRDNNICKKWRKVIA